MATIELPDDVAAAAAERDTTEAEFIAEVVVSAKPEPLGLDGFLGCMDSGDPEWAGIDTKVLRKAAEADRSS